MFYTMTGIKCNPFNKARSFIIFEINRNIANESHKETNSVQTSGTSWVFSKHLSTVQLKYTFARRYFISNFNIHLFTYSQNIIRSSVSCINRFVVISTVSCKFCICLIPCQPPISYINPSYLLKTSGYLVIKKWRLLQILRYCLT